MSSGSDKTGKCWLPQWSGTGHNLCTNVSYMVVVDAQPVASQS